MTLPKYDKSKRKKYFEVLPKGAYVVKIREATKDPNKSGKGSHLTIAFDIAEGKYKDFYWHLYDRQDTEDKKWPKDAYYYLSIPEDGASQFIWDNYNTFFADLEDSNGGFVFDGEKSLKQLNGKLIGGKFNNEQSEFNGKIYDHIHMKWTCVADDVRNGKAGQLPNDKYIMAPAAVGGTEDFMIIPDGTEDENPFA